jgi:hypothetical protein
VDDIDLAEHHAQARRSTHGRCRVAQLRSR